MAKQAMEAMQQSFEATPPAPDGPAPAELHDGVPVVPTAN
jgi:hypothetical protein